MDRGACQATVHGVAKNRTRLSDFHFPTPQVRLVAQASESPPLLGPLSGTLFLASASSEGLPCRRPSSACLQEAGHLLVSLSSPGSTAAM